MDARHVTFGGYLLTYVALVALAAVSLGLSYLPWPHVELAASLLIASTKAFLVFWYFMHLAEQRFSSRGAMIVAGILLVLLVSLTALDVLTRHTFPVAPAEAAPIR